MDNYKRWKNFGITKRCFLQKGSDKKKNLHTIIGIIEFPNNINKCKKEMKKVVSELSLLFPFATKKDWGKYDMSEGHYFPVTFDFKDSSRASEAADSMMVTANDLKQLSIIW